MTVYYRFASRAEAKDFRECGRLRPGPNSAEGKYLTDTEQNARRWGRSFGEAGIVMKIDVEGRLYCIGENIDGIGRAWFATVEQLAFASVEILHE